MRAVIRYYETGGAVHHLAGFENGRPVWTAELGEAEDYSDDADKARATLKACIAYHGREEIVLVRIRRAPKTPIALQQYESTDLAHRAGFAAGAAWAAAGLRVAGNELLDRARKADARIKRIREGGE